MIMSILVLLRIGNALDKRCTGNQDTLYIQ